MFEKINRIREEVRKTEPLIHSITNPISINQCANAVLSIGGRPIMAEHPKEVGEITKTAKAVLLNLGNITDVRMQSMMISSYIAEENKIPVVLDLVGIACSELRYNFALRLIKEHTPMMIKGNYSEINALYNRGYKSSGVDADLALDGEYISKVAVELSKKYGSIILASGATDIVTDGKRLIHIKNGSPQMTRTTGTGCMLGAICACYLSVSRDIYAAVAACAVMGICGELSTTDKGNGTFFVNLMDSLSALCDTDVEKLLRMEGI